MTLICCLLPDIFHVNSFPQIFNWSFIQRFHCPLHHLTFPAFDEFLSLFLYVLHCCTDKSTTRLNVSWCTKAKSSWYSLRLHTLWYSRSDIIYYQLHLQSFIPTSCHRHQHQTYSLWTKTFSSLRQIYNRPSAYIRVNFDLSNHMIFDQYADIHFLCPWCYQRNVLYTTQSQTAFRQFLI